MAAAERQPFRGHFRSVPEKKGEGIERPTPAIGSLSVDPAAPWKLKVPVGETVQGRPGTMSRPARSWLPGFH